MCLIILIFQFVFNVSLAQEKNQPKPSLYIEAFDSNLLSNQEILQMNKTLLQSSTRLKNYTIVLSPNMIIKKVDRFGVKDLDLYKIQITIEQLKNAWRWKGVFVDVYSNKSQIQEDITFPSQKDLIWNGQVLIERLLTKIVNFKKSDDLLIAPASQESTAINEVKGNSKEEKFDSGIDAFRNKIANLKLSVESQIQKIQEKIDNQEKLSSSSSTPEEKREVSESGVNNTKLSSSPDQDEVFKNKTKSLIYSRILIYGSYEKEGVTSVDNIETETPFTFMGIEVSYERAFTESNYNGWQFYLKYKQNFSKVDDDVSPQLEGEVNLYQKLFSNHYLGIALISDIIAFNNLPELFGGLKAGELSTYFYQFFYRFKSGRHQFDLGKAWLAKSKSSYKSISGTKKFSGDLLRISYTLDQFLFRMNLHFVYQKSTINTSDAINQNFYFKLEQSSFSGKLSYDF